MSEQARYRCWLVTLILCAGLLSVRLAYTIASSNEEFPIRSVKVIGSFNHISRKQVAEILKEHTTRSFFLFSPHLLKQDLLALSWMQDAQIERLWPDTLKITLWEKVPVACWNGALLSNKGELFRGCDKHIAQLLPTLNGPQNQQQEVLQIYQKLSKLLATYGLYAQTLQLRHNQAWELTLTNGTVIRLGKQEMEKRLQRFLYAYPAIVAHNSAPIVSADLRYARGMALQWKEANG